MLGERMWCFDLNQNRFNRSTEHPTPQQWDGAENQKGKSKKTGGLKDFLISKAKAEYASKGNYFIYFFPSADSYLAFSRKTKLLHM